MKSIKSEKKSGSDISAQESRLPNALLSLRQRDSNSDIIDVDFNAATKAEMLKHAERLLKDGTITQADLDFQVEAETKEAKLLAAYVVKQLEVTIKELEAERRKLMIRDIVNASLIGFVVVSAVTLLALACILLAG